ncbi:nuclear transport factor 2 family protein [Symmachiella macrocystis]|nr:nuclear transport factor 2 family protein [Symmachiella macrocystis]
MKIRFAIILFAVLLSGADAPPNPLQKTLLTQESKLIEAIKQQDQATLKMLLSEETFAVTYDGGRQTGQEILRSLEHVTITSYTVTDVKLVQVSPDVGILTYKFRWKGNHGDKKIPLTTVFATSTWALRDGEWRSVFYQETPVKK